MIAGVVNARHEAVVRLRVRGPAGPELDVDTVIDSGFTASYDAPSHDRSRPRLGAPVGRRGGTRRPTPIAFRPVQRERSGKSSGTGQIM